MSSWLGIEGVRAAAMTHIFRLMSDPRVAKVLADPQVMAALMKALQLASRAQQGAREGLRSLASLLRLATFEDVSALRAEVRKLELTLEALELEMRRQREAQPGRQPGRPSA
jgi:hypothetical protein